MKKMDKGNEHSYRKHWKEKCNKNERKRLTETEPATKLSAIYRLVRGGGQGLKKTKCIKYCEINKNKVLEGI